MPETPIPASPLGAALIAGDFGRIDRGAGVSVAERRGLSLVQIAAFRGKVEAAASALAETLGVRPPAEPNTAVAGERASALWIAPGQWLAVAEGRPQGALQVVVQEAVRDAAAAVDESHARCVLRVGGPETRALLAKGCSLDLHPEAFQPGRCAQTSIGHIGALLHLVDEAPTFDVHVPRGYALAFWEWLADSAGEFGYRVL